MHILEMFRGTYPLRRLESPPRHEVTGAAADPGAKKLRFPLSTNGLLSLVQTRQVLLQFTNAAAHDVAQFFFPRKPASPALDVASGRRMGHPGKFRR